MRRRHRGVRLNDVKQFEKMRIKTSENACICKEFTIIHKYSQIFLKIAVNKLRDVLDRRIERPLREDSMV